jgi:hypothetical protein
LFLLGHGIAFRGLFYRQKSHGFRFLSTVLVFLIAFLSLLYLVNAGLFVSQQPIQASSISHAFIVDKLEKSMLKTFNEFFNNRVGGV